jgi:rod shape-determining protein MreB
MTNTHAVSMRHIVEEAMAAAIGVRLPVHEAGGIMVIDIGGGTTDIAVIALNGIVQSRNIRIAGDKFNSDIMTFIRDEFKIVIGERTAEELKWKACSVREDEAPIEATVRGRDLVSGLPREVTITDADIRDAISHSVDTLISSIREVIEATPPEVIADVMQTGAYLTGGGSLIRGLPELLEHVLKIPIHVADDPLTSVVRGAGIILENLEQFQEVLLDQDEAFVPTTT